MDEIQRVVLLQSYKIFIEMKENINRLFLNFSTKIQNSKQDDRVDQTFTINALGVPIKPSQIGPDSAAFFCSKLACILIIW